MKDFVSKHFLAVKGEYSLDVVLKELQKLAINAVCNGKDTLVSLPTGYGKTLIILLPPLLMDKEYPGQAHCSLIVSPLKALMEDQEMLLQRLKIGYCKLDCDTTEDQLQNATVILTSPEVVIQAKLRGLLIDQLSGRLVVLAYDECHCISKWGATFRPDYLKVGHLQSYFDSPVLALSATVNQSIKADLHQILKLKQDCVLVSLLPDRPNIRMVMLQCTERFRDELQWLVVKVQSQGQSMEKIILFTPTIDICQQIYNWLLLCLRLKAFKYNEASPQNRLIEMFHRGTDRVSKECIIRGFKEENSVIRLVVCTIAFGIGIDIPNVHSVIIWGVPNCMLDLLQLIGRAGRDGNTSFGVCYSYPRSRNCNVCRKKDCTCTNSDKALTVAATLTSSCVRHVILDQFDLQNKSLKYIENPTCETKECVLKCQCKSCTCCSACAKRCHCRVRLIETFLDQL